MTTRQRYNSYVGYFKKVYGQRLQKVVIDGGFTCPNRDGSISTGGCTYCDNSAFHPGYSTPNIPILTQIDEGIKFHKVRYRNAERFLAYFQPYSNTYAPLERLKVLYEEALSHPQVAGIVIGTRPDCVDEQKLDYLAKLAENHIVIVEYGIESCYDRTLERINRGHSFEQARRALEMTAERGIRQGAHFIFGLPGECVQDMIDSASIINTLPLHSVKFHQLQIVRGTAMEEEFVQKRDDFVTFALDEYIDFFVSFLERLRPDIYIERFAGEVPPRFLNTIPWGMIRNVELVRMLEKRLEELDTWQGRLLE
ncbi:MAG: TIGR01212 family radical SAM protein [Bacteroidales bacterium]|nr:TIGR01212 family radical SAM protein [Bacteroidales bacterium]MBQ5747889.1 TIGR01212 family radical SAM protein [Bacteroidales bacterium]